VALGLSYEKKILFTIDLFSKPHATGIAVDTLKYQSRPLVMRRNTEWATIKYRYKLPHGETSVMRSVPVLPHNGQTEDFVFATSVAKFGMLLTSSNLHTGSRPPMRRR